VLCHYEAQASSFELREASLERQKIFGFSQLVTRFSALSIERGIRASYSQSAESGFEILLRS